MQEKSEKSKQLQNSLKLLRIESTRRFSRYTTDLITNLLMPLRENPTMHDQMVVRVLDILEANDTEEKVIQSLEEEIQRQ